MASSLDVRLALNTSEAAKALGVSRRTLQRILDRGEIHFKQEGARRIIPRASLEQWLRGGEK